jgi:hypothetical protein
MPFGCYPHDDLVVARWQRRADFTIATRRSTDYRNRSSLPGSERRSITGTSDWVAEHADHLASSGTDDNGLKGLPRVHEEAVRATLADDDARVEG